MSALRDRAPLRARLAQLVQEIAALGRQIRNCVDAVALGGTDAFADELRSRARELQERKREFTIEHEQVRQELAACDQEGVADDRIREALSRFGEVFPALNPSERARLMQLCFDRIDVTVQIGGQLGVRQLRLALRVSVGRFVEGMEEKTIMDHLGARGTRIERRRLSLSVTMVVDRNGTPSIQRPFALTLKHRQFDGPGRPKRECLHPLHRALAWHQLLVKRPDQTMKEFAAQQQISIATLYYHFALLKLNSKIQSFLLNLRDRESVRRYGMIPLLPLTKLDSEHQLQQFALLADGRFFTEPTVATTKVPLRSKLGSRTAA